MRHALLLAALLAVACSDPGNGTEGDAGEINPACPYASTPGVWRAVVSGPGPTDCVYACRAEDGGFLSFCLNRGVARCVDTYTDTNNCRLCGNVCARGEICGTPTPTRPACQAP